jgi:C-terminal processing protease CtpA/Prc
MEKATKPLTISLGYLTIIILLFISTTSHAVIIKFSKCFVSKYNDEEKTGRKFDKNILEASDYVIDLQHKIVNQISIKSENQYKDQLKEFNERQGWLGINLNDVNEKIANEQNFKSINGVYINNIASKGPAKKYGLLAKDIIIEFDQKSVNKGTDLISILKSTKSGKMVDIKIWRNNKEITKKIEIGDYKKYHEEPKRYSVTNAIIDTVDEKDIIYARVKMSDGLYTLMKWSLDTKNKTIKSKAFSEKDQLVPFATLEKICK